MKSQKQKRWRALKPKPTRFKIPLEDGGFVIVVEYWLRKGAIIRFAAVLIQLHVEDQGSDEICRYDTAHGFAHLDILDNKRRVIEKIAIPGKPSYEDALTYALADLKINYQKYGKSFRISPNSKWG